MLLNFLSRIIDDKETDNITPLLSKYKMCVILAKTKYGQGIIIHLQNIKDIKSKIDLCLLDIVGITEYAEPVPPPKGVMPKFYMNSIDNCNHYSPSTSSIPLMDILHRRSQECPEIRKAISEYWNENCDNMYSIMDINNWLCEHNLSKYRFVTVKNTRNKSKIQNTCTVVDTMIICHIGFHAIWTKDYTKYIRPEIDILRYDVKSLSKSNMWNTLCYKQIGRIITISINAIITHDGAVTPYMITTYPGTTFINMDDPEQLILEFLDWLREDVTSSQCSVTLVGYYTNIFGFTILKSYFPYHSNNKWSFVGDYLVYNNGIKVKLLDVLDFSCGLSVKEYVDMWSSHKEFCSPPTDLLTKKEATCNITSLTKSAIEYTTCLYSAFTSQQDVLNILFSPCDMINYSSIEDLFVINALTKISLNEVRIYTPTSGSLQSFIYEAIRLNFIDSINVNVHNYNNYSIFKLKSVIDVIFSSSYPLGKPRYVQHGTIGKLYIALCEVKRRKDVRIPVISFDENNTLDHFDTVLTSVDIENAINIGGYSIKETGAIEWDVSSTIFSSYFNNCVCNIKNVKVDQTDLLLDQILNVSEVLTHKDEPNMDSRLLVFYAFAASYCRVALHNSISKIDSHFLSDSIIKHNYNSICIKEPISSTSSKLINKYFKKMII
ncbi:EEv maturation [Cetacean poxvirus 1]|nr:EEv maturation [Cetacean poxvirus 1]